MGLMNWLFGPPSRDKFASLLIAAMRRAGDTRELTYDKENFRLVDADGNGQMNLSNIYQEHCATPRGQRRGHLQRLVNSFVTAGKDLPEDYDEARPNLRPKLWTRATFATLELHSRIQGGKSPNMPLYPVGEHLVSTVVYDLPDSMRSLSNEELEGWGVSYYEAMEAACENLERTTVAYSRIGDGFHSAISGDNYDSSRILLMDRVRSFEVAGDTVAMVPQRDSMFVTGSDDEQGLLIMLELAEKTLREQPRPLSPVPLRLVDGEWEDWSVPREHPLFQRFHRLETEFLGGLYSEQKEMLEALHEREELDVFVASLTGMATPEEDQIFSYCVWPEGVDSLLPRSEYVMLLKGEELAASGLWEHVSRIVGDLLEPVDDLYPPRFRARTFPSAEQLAAIGKAEL